MHKGVFLCFALVVALVHASPLASDPTKKSQASTVVDVPAGIFDSEKDSPPAGAATSKKDEAKIEDTLSEKDAPQKTDAGKDEAAKDEAVKDDEEQEVPSLFGIRFPSVVIFRRPIIRDPFAGFQSPFFSRRPSIFSPSIFDEEDRESAVEKVSDQKPLASSAESNGSRVPSQAIGGMTDQLNQRISDMFASIFSIPSSSFFSRPTFSRPMFSRPSIFSPFSPASDEDGVEFDKLPANYSNSTSETKVVDGQVVTVNKTIHKVSGNNSNGFFQFQVIKIGENKAENESAGTPVIGHEGDSPAPESEVVVSKPESESGSSTPKHPEMDPQLNEVDRPEDEDKEALLSQKEMETKYNVETRDSDQEQTNEEEIKIVPFMPAKLIKAPNGANPKKATDLSSDIRVNNMMAESIGNGKLRALFNPDEVEVFDV